jgi:dipeptidyl-peptidase-4
VPRTSYFEWPSFHTGSRDIFNPDRVGLDWLEWADVSDNKRHGAYRTFLSSTGSLIEEDLISSTRRTILDVDQVPPRTAGFTLNADQTKALLATNRTKNYRYSSFADYQIQDVSSKTVLPLDPDQKGDVQYAAWSPTKPNIIAFVRNNNIYIWDNGKVTPLTSDGGPTLFHGVPDWIYEEEITESRSAMWFSPDGTHLAFLSFDDAEVPLYTVPYYMDGKKYPPTYPKEKKIRYPKAGAPNPHVKASVVNLETNSIKQVPLSEASLSPDNLIIGEVVWLTNSHEKLLLRCFNRVQNAAKHLLYDVEAHSAKVVRERSADGGWLDNNKAMKWIGKISSGPRASANDSYYLDLSDEDGWQHIYLHSVGSQEHWQLTKGEWEVRSVSSVDKSRGLIYFTSTERHPTESHPYSVSLSTGKKEPIVQARQSGFYEISVSPSNQHLVLAYTGPNIPYSQLYSLNSTNIPIRTIQSGEGLAKVLQQFKLPNVTYSDLRHPSGFNLSAKLVLPPNFSPQKKYPVLFTPYGGPGSQEVNKQMGLYSRALFASTDPALEYITYTVDNRGTGWRGRNFRNFFSRAMGTVDAEDQIWAARELAKNPWVDKNKIGIWGWSNGGYLSAKVVEKNSGVFSFAIATAPTSDCRLYDSMFMERYMGLPSENQTVYNQAAIRDPVGFLNIQGSVLIQHGTGDDNVHFQHSAALVDLLMGASVPPEKLQAQFFPDSDHGISYNKAGTFQSKQLKMKLLEEKHRVIAPQALSEDVDLVVRLPELEDVHLDLGVPNGMKETSGGLRKQSHNSRTFGMGI